MSPGNALARTRSGRFTTAAPGPCDSPANEIVAENCRPGSPPAEWDISGSGDPSIQGFATDISVDQGDTVQFKIDTPASSYEVDIYRLGYYGGDGARLVGAIPASALTATTQPDCVQTAIPDQPGELVDCGNWSVSGAWQVPSDATSGIYVARPTRIDTGGASHIVFIVRDDDGSSDLLVQTSDTTWQAYNTYGGYNAYNHGSTGIMSVKLSYNRPFDNRGRDARTWLFNSEYPMLRWLERNGYDVSYTTSTDNGRRPNELLEHRTFLSVGHDEYWSQETRDAVTAARDAGVNLTFFSGNELYWKVRREDSTADPQPDNQRTMVIYKEGSAAPSGSDEHRNCFNNYECDPSDIWTGLWREAPDSTPENALTGQISWAESDGSITVPGEYAPLRFWRNTDVANLDPSGLVTLAYGTLGFEWDPWSPEYTDSYPAGRVRLSETTAASFSGLEEHSMSLYRAPSGALVFGAGTVQWSWGLDGTHDRGTSTPDRNVQQATVNLLADMNTQPATLADDLKSATMSSDTTAPIATITSPADGSTVSPSTAITISGTAADTGGQVGAVEVSTDNGATWRPATGRTTWTYDWDTPANGNATVKVRAADDSGNLQAPPASVSVAVGAAQPPATPTGLTATATTTGITLDWDDTPDATGYHVYRSDTTNGTYTKLTDPNPVTASTWEDTTITAGATGYYQITAINTTGESDPSDPANATRTAAPPTPTGLTATATTTGITLDWDDTPDATGYHVYRSDTTNGTYTKLTDPNPVTASTWEDTTITAGATGYYQITAINTTGESDPSDPANATRTAAPPTPTGLTATATTTGITLDWDDTPDATGYHVYRSDTTNGTYTKLTDPNPVTASTWEDTTITAGATGYYQITAINTTGESDPSDPANATRTAAPPTPTGLTATATTTGITLDWDDTPEATGYHVYRLDTDTGTYAKLTTDLVTDLSWDDTLAPVGTSYYQVTAVNTAGGETTPSTEANATMAKAMLLSNPSFELDDDANDRPDGWGSTPRFLRNNAGARSGAFGGTHETTNSSYTVGQTVGGLTGGTEYTFAGWVNIPATADDFMFTLEIEWQRPKNRTISTQTVATLTTATSGWRKVSGAYTAPARTTLGVVKMVASSVIGPIHVDDMTLR